MRNINKKKKQQRSKKIVHQTQHPNQNFKIKNTNRHKSGDTRKISTYNYCTKSIQKRYREGQKISKINKKEKEEYKSKGA